jgi:hypothetical protein
MPKKLNNKYSSQYFPPFDETWKNDFIERIPNTKRKQELITYVQFLDWEKISEQAISEMKKVMKKINIPEINETLKLNRTIVEGILLANLKRRLHPIMLYHLEKIRRSDSKIARNKKINTLINRAEWEIRYCRSIYEMIADFSGIKWIKDTKTLNEKMKELEKYSDKGIEFSRGKRNRKNEIPHFEAIEKKYNEQTGTSLEQKYRSIAINVAKFDLELIHEREQVNFYKRFMSWHNKNLKK